MSAQESSSVENSMYDTTVDTSGTQLTTAVTDDWSVQDTDERRQIRHRYRELIQDMQERDETSIQNLKEKLNEAHELFTKVRLPREAALDSKLLRQLSTAAMRKAEAMDTNAVSFDPNDFVSRFAAFVTSNETASGGPIRSRDWKQFGMKMLPLFKLAPSFNPMLGTFSRAPLPPPVRKQRLNAAKELKETGTATAPTKLKEMGKSEHELTTEAVETVLHHLHRLYEKNGRNALCLFEFACHPTSFAQTVQNIFHISFLVKDGFAVVFLDNDQLPVIEPIERNRDEASGNTQELRDRKEFVLSISRPEWEEVVKVFQIKCPIIPATITTRDRQ